MYKRQIQDTLTPFFEAHKTWQYDKEHIQGELAMMKSHNALLKKELGLIYIPKDTLDPQEIDQEAINELQSLRQELKWLRESFLGKEFTFIATPPTEIVDEFFISKTCAELYTTKAALSDMTTKYDTLKEKVNVLQYFYSKYHIGASNDHVLGFIGSPAMRHLVATRQDMTTMAALVKEVLSDVPVTQDCALLTIEKNRIAASLASSNKLLERTQRAFNDKASLLQQIMVHVLGWQLKWLSSSKFKLVHKDAYLVFQSESEAIQLLGMSDNVQPSTRDFPKVLAQIVSQSCSATV